MFKMEPYHAVFEISGPLDPQEVYSFFWWFPRDTKITYKKCMVVLQLNKYVAQGAFDEAGRYAFVMRQEKLLSFRYGLFKIRKGEDGEKSLEMAGKA